MAHCSQGVRYKVLPGRGLTKYCDNLFVKISIPTVCFAHMGLTLGHGSFGESFLFSFHLVVTSLVCYTQQQSVIINFYIVKS